MAEQSAMWDVQSLVGDFLLKHVFLSLSGLMDRQTEERGIL